MERKTPLRVAANAAIRRENMYMLYTDIRIAAAKVGKGERWQQKPSTVSINPRAGKTAVVWKMRWLKRISEIWLE